MSYIHDVRKRFCFVLFCFIFVVLTYAFMMENKLFPFKGNCTETEGVGGQDRQWPGWLPSSAGLRSILTFCIKQLGFPASPWDGSYTNTAMPPSLRFFFFQFLIS